VSTASDALDVLLAPVPSALQALLILGLVALVLARESLRLNGPAPALALGVRILAPLVLLLLVLRLVVILQ
jgi:hypothetical protein